MAFGKARPNKRSSGGTSSYASTITTVIFVSLCVLGVWFLNSDSLTPPQSTTLKTSTNKKIAALEENAFKSDDSIHPKENNSQEENSGANTKEVENVEKQEENRGEDPTRNKQQEEPERMTSIGGGGGDDQSKSDLEENAANKKGEGVMVVEENPQGLQGKESVEENEKQKEHEIQVSEESSMTQNQVVEEITSEKNSELGEDQSQEKRDQDHEKITQKNSELGEDQSQQQKRDQQDREEIGNTERQEREHEQQQKEQISQEVQEEEKQKQENESLQQTQQKKQTSQEVQEEEKRKQEKEQLSQEVQEEEKQKQENESQQQTQQKEQISQEFQEEEKPKQENDESQKQTGQSQEGTSQDQIEHDQALPMQSHDPNEDQRPQETTSTEQAQAGGLETKPHHGKPKRRHKGNLHKETKRKNENKEGQLSNSDTKQKEDQKGSPSGSEDSPLGGESSEIPKESKESKKSWSTQADQSEDEKERRKGTADQDGSVYGYTWQLCNVTAGTDYIPCLDNEKALRKLRTTRHYEHRERHCPEPGPTCLVPLPEGYKRPITWPTSRDKIWYHNVPHTKLAEVKGHQNWVKLTGEFLTFPGGGTQFIHGALHYIEIVQAAVPNIGWGKHTRVILDVGSGVASFGGFLFEKDVLAMSFAPKDEHEAQVQFALERGIPAISAVMGTQRLPFPSRVFDLLHCARCRVPWHIEGGSLLLELNRVLRPGGYFVWSATPVYQNLEEDVEIWKEMTALTKSMCWDLITIKKDKINSIGVAVYQKPASNECYDQRKQNSPPLCKSDDDSNAAWYVPLQPCMHRVPVDEAERGSKWPEDWPRRLQTPPYWLNKSQMGIYGKPAPDDFAKDYQHWKRVVTKSYLTGLGISWDNVRNIMDMRAVYGGFAAAMKDLKVWVLNVVNINSPDTLPIIYERGLFGIYHDWCESFSTYPRSYDLLHADHLFSRLKKRCKLVPVMAEIDRIVRPGGKLIVRDESGTIGEVENLLKSLHWEVHLTFSKHREGILSAQKSDWRPNTYEASSS